MTRFAARFAGAYNTFYNLVPTIPWFAICGGAAVCGLGAYNESGAANRNPPAARRKTPLCLQYRDLRRGTWFAGRFLKMKKSFILPRRRRFDPFKYF